MFQVRRILVFQIVFHLKKKFSKKLRKGSSRFVIYYCGATFFAVVFISIILQFLSYMFAWYLEFRA